MDDRVNFPYEHVIDTDLHCAIQAHAPLSRIVALVESEGKHVDGRNKSGQTPLMCAASMPDVIPVIDFLILKGADVNAQDLEDFTPLYYACRHGQAAQVHRRADTRGGKAGLGPCMLQIGLKTYSNLDLMVPFPSRAGHVPPPRRGMPVLDWEGRDHVSDSRDSLWQSLCDYQGESWRLGGKTSKDDATIKWAETVGGRPIKGCCAIQGKGRKERS